MKNGNGQDRAKLQGPIRCAIYTRKSTEEGLEQEFNSLDAQREAGEAFIKSQRHEGWIARSERYDDGGYSGGTMDRPALKRLMADVEAGRVDCIVVYKVDRLSRSLMDFSRLVETLDHHGVSFVSVTQQFNTSTSMGRLTLNMLLSFAQFEREVTAERIRDKFTASRKRGKHMGGVPPLGYDIDRAQKKLIVNPEEAKLVRHIFRRFLKIGSATKLAQELNETGHRTKSWTTLSGNKREGRVWDKGHLYRALNNPLYVGEVQHKGQRYPGEHDAIVDRATWDRVRSILARNCQVRGNRTRARTEALLRGLIRCAHCDSAMGPTFTKRRGKTYRSYLCVKAAKRGAKTCPVRRVSAGEIEGAVIGQLRAVFRTPEVLARTIRKVREQEPVSEEEIKKTLGTIDGVWEHLFPAERERIVKLLVERIEVREDGLEMVVRAEGLRSLVADLGADQEEVRGAA